MDHLPVPNRPKYPTPEVLVHCRDISAWDSQCRFEDFPALAGWSLEKLQAGGHGQMDATTEAELRSFLQEWLYFRLVQALFAHVSIQVDLDDLTRRNTNGELVIDTLCLIRYISAFEGAYRELDKDEKLGVLQQLQHDLRLAHGFVGRNCSMVADDRQRDSFWPFNEVENLAFMVLGATLSFAIYRIASVDPTKPAVDMEDHYHRFHNQWGVSKLLYDRMIADGWCPNLMAQLVSGDSSILGIYYASLLQFDVSRGIHHSCEAKICHVAQVDENTYQTKHMHDLPACVSHGPTPKNVNGILTHKTFPVLHLIESQDGTIDLEALPFEPGMSFVAISHVWADGLGNVEDNSLPRCQVERIGRLVKSLYPYTSQHKPMYFWIDTICVPRKRETDEQDYRKLAIDQLREVYLQAHKVLVLDSELIDTSAVATPEENLMRIRLCGWMRRLWTLQEAMLGSKIRFQFRERALDPEDLLSKILPEHHQSVWYESYEFFLDLNPKFFKAKHPSIIIARLWSMLQWRQTSHASDETICLSILTDRDLSQITSVKPKERLQEERMKTFWRQAGIAPSHIIFMPGPRIDEDGWRWAPTSFMSRHRWTPAEFFQKTLMPSLYVHTFDHRCLPGDVTEQGLICKLPSLLLEPFENDTNMIFYVHEQALSFLMVATCLPEIDDKTGWDDWDLKKIKNPALLMPAWPEMQSQTLAILVTAEAGTDDASSQVQEDHDDLKKRASIENPDDHVRARFVSRFTITVIKEIPESAKSEKIMDPNTKSWKSQHVTGMFSDQRKWRIG